VLAALGAWLRFHRIDGGLWYDEILTLVDSVRAPLADILTRFPGDNHHPLYSVLAHVAIAAFGESPWALRLPAALFGVATIPLLYLVGRLVSDRLEAGAAALILTVSYHHIWFSQNARGYTAVLFFVLLSTYALLRWIDDGRRSFIVTFVMATALGAYAHLTTVLVAAGQALAIAIGWLAGDASAKRRADWPGAAAAFGGAALLTVLLYAPMLVDIGSVMARGDASGGDKAALSWTVAAVLQGLQVGFGALGAIVVGAVIFGAGVVSYLRQRPIVALLFVLPVIVTVSAALILNRPVRPRFLFFSAGFGLLFTVRGAAAIGRLLGGAIGTPRARSWAAPLMVALLTSGAVLLSARSLPYGYRYPKQDYPEAVAFVERTKEPGDVVVVVGDGAEIPIVRYLGRPWPRVDAAPALRALRERGAGVWVVSTFPSYIESDRPDLWAVLEQECRVIHEIEGTVDDGDITIRRCPPTSVE
jgi:hypothetical protein